MDKRNWELYYTSFEGPEKKAIELIYKELGTLILRDSGMYTFHTLACKKSDILGKDKNAIVLGKYYENKILQKYISPTEIPENGYIVKVINNPENEEYKLVLITAFDSTNVFYGAVDFVDDYFAVAAHKRADLTFFNEIFQHNLPDYCNASAPIVKKRNIFTWGHSIDDYIEYIDNAARLKYNEIIIWNDFAPLNAKEIVNYAHEYGIKIIWGYAWGWQRGLAEIDLEFLKDLPDKLVDKYVNEYADTGADGIYFQSVTELQEEYIGGKLIAEEVVKLVNTTTNKLLKLFPNLKIQFGLHASSVKKRLEFIKLTDERIDIIWEDCGAFPYSYTPYITDEEEFKSAEEFTEKMINLRNKSTDGVLFKGVLKMDWDGIHFVHQEGPYILGKASATTKNDDTDIIKPLWKDFQNGWLKDGEYAYKMTKTVIECSNQASIGIAGQLTNGIWLPAALLAQILWECDKPYKEIFRKVLNRRCIKWV